MFGSTTRATSGGQLWIGTTDETDLRIGRTGNRAVPRQLTVADMDRTWREHARMALAADRRRQAAYRRLALTVLGLDVQTLVETLPLTGKETADQL
jgi:hypothetical protein